MPQKLEMGLLPQLHPRKDLIPGNWTQQCSQKTWEECRLVH